MLEKKYLMIPGPTYVSARVLRAMSSPMVNHRGAEFAQLFEEVMEGVKGVFNTSNDVIIFPSSGTGAMEAAITNTLSPGDRVLACPMGAFGERFAQIARAFGAEVEELAVEWGEAVSPEAIGARLSARPDIKAVLVTHNETSTGVTLDLEGVARAVREYPALLIVDAISGLGAIPLRTDEWGVDVVVAGSQKALMIPPGLSLVSVSERAWEAHARARMPRYYWDFGMARKSAQKRQNPYTPAVPLWYALREALKMIQEEGQEAIYQRHRLLGSMVRHALKALGLSTLARDPERASNTVTAVVGPPGLDLGALRRMLNQRFGVVTAGGQGKLQDRIFRIGHLGSVTPMDVVATIAALEMALAELGYEVEFGSGVAEAQRAWLGGAA